MRNLFVICTIALIFGVNSARVGICQFNGDFSGEVTFTETVNEEQDIVVEVSGTITGPKEITGEHGFHIHQYGDLRDNIGSAGSHFNPYDQEHGCTPPSHLGDLENILFTAGATESTATIDKSIIDAELYSDITLIGRTLVIHEKKDDCSKTPELGARIAQCVIGYQEGDVGYLSPSADKTTPQAICVLEDMELQIIFEQDESIGSVKATINKTDYANDIFLSLNESVNTPKFTSDYSKQLFDTTLPKPLPTNVIVNGLSIRYSTEGIVNIIGKAVYCVDGDKVQHSCVIGFYNSAYPPATTTATATSSSTSATADPTTGSSSSTGDATSTTTGAANATTTTTGDLIGNATSTTGSTTMTNTTTDASSTSGQAINPALNTTDTSGGAVLGIIFATFILLGLAWYTYVNRGNNQRRIGYFGV